MSDSGLDSDNKVIRLLQAMQSNNVMTGRMRIEHDPDDPEYCTMFNVGHADDKLCAVIEFYARDGENDAGPRAEEFYLTAPQAHELAGLLMDASEIVKDYCVDNDICLDCGRKLDGCICEKGGGG